MECVHCGGATPVPVDGPTSPISDDAAIPTPTATPAAISKAPEAAGGDDDDIRDGGPATARRDRDDGGGDGDDSYGDEESEAEERRRLHERVLRAAYDAAATSSGPTFLWERKHNLFQLCAAQSKKATGKNVKRLRKMLEADDADGTLARARTANMSSSLGLPDGYTTLHAACHAGNVEVVEYLLGTMLPGDDLLDEVDVQGRTALHVASHMGHAEVVLLLKHAYERTLSPSSSSSSSSSSLAKEEEEEEGAEGAEAGGGGGKEEEEAVVVVGARMAGLSVADPPPSGGDDGGGD